MTEKTFTPEEIEQLKKNIYVSNVTTNKLSYTLEFKQFALREAKLGTKSPDIFAKAGFDTEVLGKARMYAAIKAFKIQDASPKGLRASTRKSREERLEQFAKEDFNKKQTKAAICELQKKIVHLEQQIEFLKKIQSLDE